MLSSRPRITCGETNDIEQLLGMVKPSRIICSPDKENLRLSCVDVRSSVNSTMDIILKEIQMKQALLPRIIIFCKSTFDCAKLYTYFEMNMGPDFTEPLGATHSLQVCRRVDMYFKGTETVVKNKIVKSFMKATSCLCMIVKFLI